MLPGVSRRRDEDRGDGEGHSRTTRQEVHLRDTLDRFVILSSVCGRVADLRFSSCSSSAATTGRTSLRTTSLSDVQLEEGRHMEVDARVLQRGPVGRGETRRARQMPGWAIAPG